MTPQRLRIAWCITGSGHYLEESIALAARLPALDLFLSDAAEEVLPLSKMRLDELKPRFGAGFRLLRDKTASGVPLVRKVTLARSLSASVAVAARLTLAPTEKAEPSTG